MSNRVMLRGPKMTSAQDRLCAPISMNLTQSDPHLRSRPRTFRTFRALYAEEFFAAVLQSLNRFHGLRPERRGSALPFPACAGTFTARQASLDCVATDRSVAPPIGLLTLGFDLPVSRSSRQPATGSLAITQTGLAPLAMTTFEPGQITSCRSFPVPVRTLVRCGTLENDADPLRTPC